MVATPALPSKALSINLAVWLKRKRCHHFEVAITGNTTVTALSLLRRRMLSTYSLSGSMNITYNGVDRLTEMLDFQTERGAVEQLRLSFQSEYGGRI